MAHTKDIRYDCKTAEGENAPNGNFIAHGEMECDYNSDREDENDKVKQNIEDAGYEEKYVEIKALPRLESKPKDVEGLALK